MANFITGTLLKGITSGSIFLIENNQKRTIPDSETLNALTVGLGTQLLSQVSDTTINTLPSGSPFISLSNFITANPLIAKFINNAALAIIPSTGLQNLAGGMATIANAVANMYADAIANPPNWSQTIQQIKNAGSSAAAQALIKLLSQTITNFINAAIKQFGGNPTSADDDVDDAVNNTGDGVANGKEDKDDPDSKDDDKDNTDATNEKDDKDNKDDPDQQKDDKDNKDDPDQKNNKDDTDQKNDKDDTDQKNDKDNKDDPDQKNDKDNKDDPDQKNDKDDEDADPDPGNEGDDIKRKTDSTNLATRRTRKPNTPDKDWESLNAK